MKKLERRWKHWTFSEVLFLRQNWTKLKIKQMAKKLKRSEYAIIAKAYKIGLRDRKQLLEEITFNQLVKILGYNPIWRLENSDFPISKWKLRNKEIKIVNLDNFMRWLKRNIHTIDLSNTEDGDFNAVEPKWLIEKRKADKLASCYKPRFWTDEEDKRLISLLNEFKYSYRDLSIKLKRSEPAIKRRMTDLKIKARPIKEEKRYWTSEEINKVKDLYLKGYKPCVIAEYINRTALSINGILERNNYWKESKYVK